MCFEAFGKSLATADEENGEKGRRVKMAAMMISVSAKGPVWPESEPKRDRYGTSAIWQACVLEVPGGPVVAVILGPGRGFEIAQGRLGPGRIHHCMRAIGMAERALELMCRRSISRTAFGKPLAKLGGNYDRIAEARMNIDMARLLTLRTGYAIDTAGVPEAQVWISKIKAAVPKIAIDIIDDAIQMHGATGLSKWTPLAGMYTAQRTLRFADGPDEVHHMGVGRNEVRRYDLW